MSLTLWTDLLLGEGCYHSHCTRWTFDAALKCNRHKCPFRFHRAVCARRSYQWLDSLEARPPHREAHNTSIDGRGSTAIRATEACSQWEWADDSLILTYRLPATRTQPQGSLPKLFPGLAAYYKNAQANFSTSRKNVTSQSLGEGTPTPGKYLEILANITDEIRVLHGWERGDVLVYDNVIA